MYECMYVHLRDREINGDEGRERRYCIGRLMMQLTPALGSENRATEEATFTEEEEGEGREGGKVWVVWDRKSGCTMGDALSSFRGHLPPHPPPSSAGQLL